MKDQVGAAISQARQALAQAHEAIGAEISNYPTPISGCDAQFNHLLALRGQISAARAALDTDVFVPTPRSPSRYAGVENR